MGETIVLCGSCSFHSDKRVSTLGLKRVLTRKELPCQPQLVQCWSFQRATKSLPVQQGLPVIFPPETRIQLTIVVVLRLFATQLYQVHKKGTINGFLYHSKDNNILVVLEIYKSAWPPLMHLKILNSTNNAVKIVYFPVMKRFCLKREFQIFQNCTTSSASNYDSHN